MPHPNPEYMKAAKKNMAPPEAPSEEPPEAVGTMQLSLTETAIAELSKPENKEELMKLVEAGIVAMAEGMEALPEPEVAEAPEAPPEETVA